MTKKFTIFYTTVGIIYIIVGLFMMFGQNTTMFFLNVAGLILILGGISILNIARKLKDDN